MSRSFARKPIAAGQARHRELSKAALQAGEQRLADARDDSRRREAEHAVAPAKKALKAAEAELAAVEAAIAADSARYAEPPARRSRRADPRRRPGSTGSGPLLKAEEALLQGRSRATAKPRTLRAKQPGKAKPAEEAAATPLKTARRAKPSRPPASAVSDDGAELLAAHARSTRRPARAGGSPWRAGSPIPDNPLTARVASTRSGCATSARRWSRRCSTSAATASRPRSPPCSTGWPSSFEAEGWRMKPIHRLIVTSAAYRMQSTGGGPDDPNLARTRQHLLLADEPQAHGGRGRARQSALRGAAASIRPWAGPTSTPRRV